MNTKYSSILEVTTNPEILLGYALDLPGINIQRISQITGLTVEQILGMDVASAPGYYSTAGWCAVRTCGADYNARVNFPNAKGDFNFWLGAASGVRISIYLGDDCQGYKSKFNI